MKELLYLKDEQIKDFIQLLFYAYRETFSDPKEILAKNSFGPAQHRQHCEGGRGAAAAGGRAETASDRE